MVGGRQSARPRADDEDSLAGPNGRLVRTSSPRSRARSPRNRSTEWIDTAAVEICSVADGFTRVIAHPAVDGGEWVVLDELSPRGFVPTGGGVRKPGLDVLSGGASGIARRHQIDVDGPALAHRPGPRAARG